MYWFVRHTLGVIRRLLLRVEVIGSEKIPERGGFIIASNHRSHLDPVMFCISTQRKIVYMAKRELFDVPIVGGILHRAGVIKLNRDGLDKAVLKSGIRVIKEGRGLGFFPEGTRSLDGKLGAGKGGVSVFAFSTNVPVIPAFISGTEQAMPSGKCYIRPAKIRITFGNRLIAPRDVDRSEKKALYQNFTDSIMQEIARLEKEAT